MTKYITDTPALQYFLLTGEIKLLLNLLGSPLQVPLAVYDPEDRDVRFTNELRTSLLSEMRKAIFHYKNKEHFREENSDYSRLLQVDNLYSTQILIPVAMKADELELSAALQSRNEATKYGVKAGLGPGEAACVAIAFHRGCTIVTDDNDALKVMKRLYEGRDFPYERIRKLLKRAARDGHISESAANNLHQEMLDKGFWDTESPFPDAETE